MLVLKCFINVLYLLRRALGFLEDVLALQKSRTFPQQLLKIHTSEVFLTLYKVLVSYIQFPVLVTSV